MFLIKLAFFISIIFRLFCSCTAVLDDMRERFRENPMYFQDSINDVAEYVPDNILNVPTEREISVIERNLPVYRALFTRTNTE